MADLATHFQRTYVRRLLAVLPVLTTLLLWMPSPAAAQQICYAVADAGGANGGDDLLTRVNRNTGAETTIGTGLGTSLVEAIAYSPFQSKLYGANAGQFGEINTTTGVFSNIGTGFGTGNGPLGNIAFSDVDGLHFDPFPGELHGVHRRSGANENDLLFQIDRTTGAFIPGAFPDADGNGTPDDYLEIKSGVIGVWDIDDLAIDPVTSTMYATGNNGGASNVLLTFNRITGVATLIGSVGYDDIEGISFDTDGQLFGSSGTQGGTYSNYLFDINKSTGAGSPVGPLTAGSDYEGLACLTDGKNQVSGYVFLDANENGVRDGETGTSGIIVRIFRDTNGNGEVDPGEPQVGTQTTNSFGYYLFEIAGSGDFVIRVLEGDLPTGSTFTTDDLETASFPPGTYGAHDQNNDFGYTAPSASGPLTISKTSNATGPVPPGFTLLYTLTIQNTGAVPQTGIAVRDTLPPGITYVANSTWVTAPGTINDTFRDEFNAVSYSGNNGSANWNAPWSEINDDNKPDKKNVQVSVDGANPPYAVFIDKQDKGLERTANLTPYSSASLTFRYRGQGTGAGDVMRVYVNGNQVAQVTGAQTSYTTFGPVNINTYAGGNATVRFLVTTFGGGGRQFWIDDVQVSATGSGTTTTAGNPPPLLTSGQTLAAGQQMTVTFQATVNASPASCEISNKAWVQSDQSTPQSDTHVDVIDSSTSCTLPVELVAFDALTDGPDVLLSWATASETNNAGFEVQMLPGEAPGDKAVSEAGWAVLGWVDGHGTTLEAQTYRYRIADLAPGRYTFRLKQVDYDGTFDYSPEVEVFVEMAERFLVDPVYPNPFNPEATLRFAVRQQQAVRVELFDVLGRRVALLYAGEPEAGQMQTVRIDGAGLPSGLYLVRVLGERFAETQRITLIK